LSSCTGAIKLQSPQSYLVMGGACMDLLLGIVMGVAYVVPPGPVNIETIRRGLTGGFRAALAMQLGAVIGDMVYAILAVAGVGLLLTHVAAQAVLGLVGTGLLVYLGWSALRSELAIVDMLPCSTSGSAVSPSTHQSFWAGVAISIANPYSIAFWLSVGGSIMQQSQRQGVVFLSGFFLGSLLSSLLIARLVGQWRSHVSPQFLRWTSGVCGVALIAFGLGLGFAMMPRW
jgi:chemosensory pili system protein ChpE